MMAGVPKRAESVTDWWIGGLVDWWIDVVIIDIFIPEKI